MRRPAFSYYGAKFRIGRHYPPPMHDTIIEPFAGAAGYSIHYWDRDVILVDLDECIAAVWAFLIDSDPDSIRQLPLITPDTNIRALEIPEAAQWLIGYWSGQGTPHPRVTPSRWPSEHDGSQNSGWTEATREHVATVAQRVSHGRIIHGDYTAAPDVEATWFVDPPAVRAVHATAQYMAASKWRAIKRGGGLVQYGESVAATRVEGDGMTESTEMITRFRGYDIRLDETGDEFVFCDNGESTAATWLSRPCGHCGLHNTEAGHDGCLGTLPNVVNACCGHGETAEAYVQFDDGSELREAAAVEFFEIHQSGKETDEPFTFRTPQ